ncbi:MAG: hypothetical protein SF172_03645 [Burkholderiales bacterium]|nr:hypothetical protein [Burkholderiales bacterium]
MPEPHLTEDTAAFDAQGSDPGREELVRLAREAVDIALSGDIKRGLALAQEANARARASGDRRAELAALNAAARCHSLRNDSISSLAAGTDAAALARILGDGVALGHALCAIANTSFTLKLLAECEPFVLRAIDEALNHGDADLESRARQSYGVLLGDLGRFDEARTQLNAAVAAARKDGRAALLLRVESNLVNVARKEARQHASQGDEVGLRRAGQQALADAATLLERTRAQQLHSQDMMLTSLMSEVHALLGDTEIGIVQAAQAMEMASQSRQHASLPPQALRLGEMLRQRGRLGEAFDVLQRGLQAAELLRPTFRIAELCAALAVVEAERGAAAAADGWRQRTLTEQVQFESGRQMAAGFLERLRRELMAGN